MNVTLTERQLRHGDDLPLLGGRPVLQSVARLLGAKSLSIGLLKTAPDSVVYRIEGGKQHVVMKRFDFASPGAQSRFTREKQMLTLLRDNLPVPKLLHYQDELGILLMKEVEGSPLASDPEPGALEQFCQSLGVWIAQLAELAPREAAEGTWWSYLERTGIVEGSQFIEENRNLLERIPIEFHAIAHNDGSLSNFLLTPDGTLYGIDFEQAAFKPAGWDLLLAARALAQRFPDRTDLIVDQLVAGFGSFGPRSAAETAYVAKIFATSQVFQL